LSFRRNIICTEDNDLLRTSIVSDASQCRIGLRGTDKNSMLSAFMVLMVCLIQLLLAQRKPINKSQ